MNETLLGIRASIEELLSQIMYSTSPTKIKRLSKAVKDLSDAYYYLADSMPRE